MADLVGEFWWPTWWISKRADLVADLVADLLVVGDRLGATGVLTWSEKQRWLFHIPFSSHSCVRPLPDSSLERLNVLYDLG